MMGRRKRSVLVVPDSRTRPAPRTEGATVALAPFDPDERGEWWWRQPRRWRREWTFETGGRTVGVLRGPSLFSSTTRIRFEAAAFEVHQGWTGRFEVRAEGGGKEPLARHIGHWLGGGRVEAPSGEALELAAVGFWGRAYELRTAERLVLLRFESHDGLARHHVRIHPADAVRRRADLPLLLALAGAVVLAPRRHSRGH